MVRASINVPELTLEHLRSKLKVSSKIWPQIQDNVADFKRFIETNASPTLDYDMVSVPKDVLQVNNGNEDDPNKDVVVCALTLGAEAHKYFESLSETLAILYDQVLNVYFYEIVNNAKKHLESEVSSSLSDVRDFARSKAALIYQRNFLDRIDDEAIRMTDSGYLLPNKSMVFYVTYGGNGSIKACEYCDEADCLHRRNDCVGLSVVHEKGVNVHAVEKGSNLLQALFNKGYYVPSDCGGKGTCGTCQVSITSSNVEKVRSCGYTIIDDLCVEGVAPREATNVSVQGSNKLFDGVQKETVNKETFYTFFGQRLSKTTHGQGNQLVFGVDLGTTTVSVQMWKATGEHLSGKRFLNPQSLAGADVVSRIQYGSDEKNYAKLRRLILDELQNQMVQMAKVEGYSSTSVLLTVLAGNTLMQHIVLGWPIQTMGKAPYEAYALHESLQSAESLGLSIGGKVFVYPSISAFVGGDVVAGLSNLLPLPSHTLFIDLGTNGEIALVKNDTIYATSTAAGPAFEGGNIECGLGGVDGAVYDVKRQDGKYVMRYYGQTPQGFCGSGLLSLLAAMLDDGVVDESGRLLKHERDDSNKRFYMDDHLYLSQNDIREIQLAKAAIRGGVHALLNHAEMSMEDIQDVYVTGAFGAGVSVHALLKTGVLDKAFQPKIHVVDGMPMKGIERLLTSKNPKAMLEQIMKNAQHIPLHRNSVFMDKYVDSMALKIQRGETDDHENR